MTDILCNNCGKSARIVRGNYPFPECGLSNITLTGIEIIRCKKCGNDDPIIPKLDDLMTTLAVAVIAKPYRLQGQEVRFLRKYLHKTFDEFARLLRVDKTTISKWENDADAVGEQSDQLIRLYALSLGDGLQSKLKLIVRDEFPKLQLGKKSPARKVNISIDVLLHF